MSSVVHYWLYRGVADEDTQRRMDTAQATWGQFANRELMVFFRDSSAILPGPPAVFVSDIFEMIHNEISYRDLVVLSNADVGFVDDADKRIALAINTRGCCHTRRRDFQHSPIEPIYTIKDGAKYPGADAFGFTKAWLDKFLDHCPDFIFSRQHWDGWLRNVMRRAGGVELDDLIWHENHPAQWLGGKCNMQNVYNERLFSIWIAAHGGSQQDYLYTNEELLFR